MTQKTTSINFKVDSLTPDRTTYKQYSIRFADEGIYVQLNVPSDYVVKFTKGALVGGADEIVLTPNGIAWVADQLATAIDKIHEKQMKGSK
jgi:hypothetical protein